MIGNRRRPEEPRLAHLVMGLKRVRGRPDPCPAGGGRGRQHRQERNLPPLPVTAIEERQRQHGQQGSRVEVVRAHQQRKARRGANPPPCLAAR